MQSNISIHRNIVTLHWPHITPFATSTKDNLRIGDEFKVWLGWGGLRVDCRARLVRVHKAIGFDLQAGEDGRGDHGEDWLH